MDGSGPGKAVAVRPATAADLPAIGEVAVATWWDTYRGILPDGAIRWFLARAYTPERLDQRLERAAALLVAEIDGRVVGFGNYIRKDEREAALVALYVLPEAQGTGAGSLLLSEGLRLLAPLDRLWLEVEEQNVKGRRFYDRKGFKPVRTIRQRFGDHESTAVEMVLEVRGSVGP